LCPPMFVCLYTISWFLFSSDHEDCYGKMWSSRNPCDQLLVTTLHILPRPTQIQATNFNVFP
jgi:hypothetical protein